jgi:uncharacterized protein YndB with AHSA1/START domain
MTAQKINRTFRMSVSINANISAQPETIWRLLTDAGKFPTWNSTVSSIDGEIKLGQRLALKVPVSERTFKPKVTELVPNQRMTWSDGAAPMFKGTRTFTLTPNADGTTDFSMCEELKGVMLPMIKGSLPDFAPVFEQYAADLKRAAEESR